MSEMSFLWSSPDEAGDGAALYTRADWARVAEILAACSGHEGVAPGYLNELELSVAGPNTVEVNTGGAVVDGKPYLNSAVVQVNIPSAVGSGNTRIDLLVLRADWTAQTVRIAVIEGTDAANPSAPSPTNDPGNVKDVVLGHAVVNTSGVVTLSGTMQFAAGGTSSLQDEAVTPAKIASRTRKLFIPALEVKTSGSVAQEQKGLSMPSDADSNVWGRAVVPSDFAGNAKVSALYYDVLGGTGGDVYLNMLVEHGAIGELPSFDSLPFAAVTVNNIGTFGPLSLPSVEIDDVLYIELIRNVHAPQDTYVGNLYITGFLLEYTADS